MKGKKQTSAKLLQCSHCPKEFRYYSERVRHELSHFPHFECETCSKKFSFVSALRRHHKQHERTESVRCEECNRKFRDDVLLKRHIKYAHKGTFICDKCNSKFSSELALRTHTKTHKPESERRYKCSHLGCTKTFNFSHHLKHHELTHTNAKQHFCSHCGKGFIQSHHLKTHLKAHDPAGKLFCVVAGCKKKFTTDYARKRHMANHKNKPDSGISSDSNSCDASISSKNFDTDSIITATCGETVSQHEFEAEISHCFAKVECASKNSSDKTDESTDAECAARGDSDETVITNENTQNIEEWPNSPFKPNSSKKDYSTFKFIKEIGDHTKVLDSCVGKEVLCLQPLKHESGTYDFTLLNNNVTNSGNDNTGNYISSDKLAYLQIESNSEINTVDDIPSVIVKVRSVCDYNQDSQQDMCAGCDCANICDAKISMYDIPLNPNELSPKIVEKASDTPNIEYRIDGVIKLKDTFDDDIGKMENCISANKRNVPFSTCKDVIGNCLMSGGDGCLCARMMAEDQAIMAQEIDDITPHPKTEDL